MGRVIEMDNASRATLMRILGPLAARHMRPLENDHASTVARQQLIALKSFAAAFLVREHLKRLETETLIILAESHAVSRRAKTVRPLISFAT